MGIIAIRCAIALAVLASLVGLGWVFHRFCVKLEDAGYLKYRKSDGAGGSGVAGALYELDHLTRPSIEHVIEVEDQNVTNEDNHGGC